MGWRKRGRGGKSASSQTPFLAQSLQCDNNIRPYSNDLEDNSVQNIQIMIQIHTKAYRLEHLVR